MTHRFNPVPVPAPVSRATPSHDELLPAKSWTMSPRLMQTPQEGKALVDGEPPLMRIHLLGAVRAISYIGHSTVPRGRKARAMLGYLCLNADEPIPRARLAYLLWDRMPDQQARTNFRQALRELSQAMGPLAGELLSTDGDTVQFNARSCWIDAVAVLSDQQHSAPCDLASLCKGELLEDVYGVTPSFDEWLLAERARFTSRLRRRLENELLQFCQPEEDPRRRAELAQRVIEFDTTHEGASRILMRALADMGERAQALREYERCRTALKSTLDVEPSPETRALYQALKTFSGTTSNAANWEGSATAPWPVDPLQTPSTVSGRLRVGVLPFQGEHASDDTHLAISQEVALGLTRYRWFDVIAPVSLPRRSTMHWKANAKRLHYVVDGKLVRQGDTLQISVCLLDVSQEARPVWSDRFEIAADDLGQLNERVIAPIVARIDPVILFIEGQRRPQRSGATSLVLLAIPLIYTLEREKYEKAGRLLRQALEADPENAKAAAWWAFWHVMHIGQGWAADPIQSAAQSQELALRAISLDPENAEALGIYAHFSAFLDKDFDTALHYFDRALRLNPNSAFVWAMSAPTYCYIGQPDRALQHLNRYRDLTPFDPHFQYWEGAYTIAYLFKGDYENAVKVGRRAVQGNSGFSADYKPLIASLGHLGRRDEAAPYITKLLSLEPTFTVEKFGKVYPFQRDEDRQRYMKGLELAGVPVV